MQNSIYGKPHCYTTGGDWWWWVEKNDSMTPNWWNKLLVCPRAMKAGVLSKSRNLWSRIPCQSFSSSTLWEQGVDNVVKFRGKTFVGSSLIDGCNKFQRPMLYDAIAEMNAYIITSYTHISVRRMTRHVVTYSPVSSRFLYTGKVLSGVNSCYMETYFQTIVIDGRRL